VSRRARLIVSRRAGLIAPRVTVHRLGSEREPIAVIDNFAANPDALCAAAATATFAAADAHYPGIRAPLPGDYLRDQRGLMAAVLREVFGVQGGVRVLDARFSVVTVPPGALALPQRLPHVDALAPGQLALVHYLVPGGTDGTAFYRHRSSGFETLNAARAPGYFAALDAELGRHGSPRGYMAGDTPLFERIGGFDGAFNRALLYRGRLLHSGAIAPGRALPADPASGRLTITGFFAVAE
jgi:hypothetical protein